LLLSVTEDHGRQIAREVKAVSFKVRDYALTNARHQYQVSSFNTLLPPGHYHLTVVLTDQESRLRESVNREILAAKSNPQRLDLSDIMPAWSAEINELTGLPQDLTISGRPGENISSLFLHFDLMRPDPSLPCTLQAWVGREHQPDSCLNQMVLMDSANPAHSYMTIDLNPLDFGKYQARIAALAGGKRVERQTSFEINPHSLPGSIRNLDEALQQLSLIASRKEIDELRSLPPDIQEKRFIEFWNANFPTPGEGVNGKMVEYYNRIAYTNQMFGGSRPGWNTDRGHVHIIYGQPDEIEKQSFENQGMPYEIWYYNRLGKRFIFRDEYGFGDYRLVTPLW